MVTGLSGHLVWDEAGVPGTRSPKCSVSEAHCASTKKPIVSPNSSPQATLAEESGVEGANASNACESDEKMFRNQGIWLRRGPVTWPS